MPAQPRARPIGCASATRSTCLLGNELEGSCLEWGASTGRSNLPSPAWCTASPQASLFTHRLPGECRGANAAGQAPSGTGSPGLVLFLCAKSLINYQQRVPDLSYQQLIALVGPQRSDFRVLIRYQTSTKGAKKISRKVNSSPSSVGGQAQP